VGFGFVRLIVLQGPAGGAIAGFAAAIEIGMRPLEINGVWDPDLDYFAMPLDVFVVLHVIAE
jgi:hypothetical protein